MKIINRTHIYLVTILLCFLFSFNSYSFINIKFIGEGAYSPLNNGSNMKARDLGYTGEGLVEYDYLSFMSLGAFYFTSSFQTIVISEGDESGVDIFNISPTGYGGDVALFGDTFLFRIGYGFYKAEARRVISGVGRDYELSGGKGYHLGIGWKTDTTEHLKFIFTITYRRISYDEIKIATSDASPVVMNDKWGQQIMGAGIGMLLDF